MDKRPGGLVSVCITLLLAASGGIIFYAEAIDGQHIDNALEHAARVNQGRGLAMTPEGKGRLVATKETQFHIAGRTQVPPAS